MRDSRIEETSEAAVDNGAKRQKEVADVTSTQENDVPGLAVAYARPALKPAL
jgi:hypothetical protein